MRLASVLAVALALPACAAADARTEKVVTIDVHYSHFSRSVIDVPRGVPVRFVIRNADPIGHELIVGNAGVQERHEKGTERDVPALATVETTIVFDTAGTSYFACHLPGHYAYGMRGLIHVTS
jgi:uncharacterized cupredoxin-like copper-binding protein